MSVIDLDIVQYSKKGNGIGYFIRQDGEKWPVEVAFTMPGDRVRVQLFPKRRRIYQSKLVEMLALSPERVSPRCIHFGVCGGCRWQHIEYQQQLQIKEQNVRKCFENLISQETEFKPILPADLIWNYRNKMEFSFSTDASKNHFLGLMMNERRGKVFQLTECHLPNSWFAETLNAVREWWESSHLDAYHPYTNQGSLRNLTLREGQRTGDRMVNLTVSGNAEFALHKHHIESFVATIRKVAEPSSPDKKLSVFLTIHQIAKGKPTQFFEMHLYGAEHIREILHIKPDVSTEPIPLLFHISPKAFFQPNSSQAERLYSTALQMASIPQNAIVYDLYCGTGTLGICVAKKAKQVVGIELSPDAAHDARYNAAANQLDNLTILTGSVEKKLQEIREEGLLPSPDIVLVDPPRAGLDPEALSQILQLSAPKIVYISCNPVTQAGNIAQLLQGGYFLKAVQPVDQFPHTIHIENIAILEK